MRSDRQPPYQPDPVAGVAELSDEELLTTIALDDDRTSVARAYAVFYARHATYLYAVLKSKLGFLRLERIEALHQQTFEHV